MATQDARGGAIYNSLSGEDALVNLAGLSGVVLADVTQVGAIGSTNKDTFVGLGGFTEAEFLLSVTAAATAVDDTLDVFIDSSNDGGVTFLNIAHFTQVLGNGGAKKEVAICMRAAAALIAVTSDVAAGGVPRAFVGDAVRVRYVVVDAGAVNASFAFKVTASFKR